MAENVNTIGRESDANVFNFKLARHAARVAGALNRSKSQNRKGKSKSRGNRTKGIEGKLLPGPGETNTSDVATVIVPAPEQAAGALGDEVT